MLHFFKTFKNFSEYIINFTNLYNLMICNLNFAGESFLKNQILTSKVMLNTQGDIVVHYLILPLKLYKFIQTEHCIFKCIQFLLCMTWALCWDRRSFRYKCIRFSGSLYCYLSYVVGGRMAYIMVSIQSMYLEFSSVLVSAGILLRVLIFKDYWIVLDWKSCFFSQPKSLNVYLAGHYGSTSMRNCYLYLTPIVYV